MKAEIAANGPISCGIHVSDAFLAYDPKKNNGIYSEHVRFPMINHEISVTGYGYDEELRKASGGDVTLGEPTGVSTASSR